MEGPVIAWGGVEAGPPSRPFVPIWTVKPNQRFIGFVLSEEIVTCQTHFILDPARPGRYHTRPHITPVHLCEGCLARRPTKRYGYLAVYGRIPRQTVGVIELTAEAQRSCPALFERGVSLRGRELTVDRMGQARNSKCHAFLSRSCTQDRLPEAPDIMRELMRLWGYQEQSPVDQLISTLASQLGMGPGPEVK